MKGLSDEMYERLREGHGRVILASARPDEQSYILSGDRNSLFTKHLLDGLRGARPVRTSSCAYFGCTNMYSRKLPPAPAQHPRFKCNLEDNFAIGFYRVDKRVAPPAAVRDDEFAYDVYISYVDKEPDSTWVWDTFIPNWRKRASIPGASPSPARWNDLASRCCWRPNVRSGIPNVCCSLFPTNISMIPAQRSISS